MHLTQAQAARAAKVSRTTIWRAVKNGRLSVVDVDGEHLIEPSELLRVFPQADLSRAHETLQGDETRHDVRHGELAALRLFNESLLLDKRRLSDELERGATERTTLLSMLKDKDEALREKDRLLADAMQTVKLVTDQRKRPPRWWARFWRKASEPF